MITARLALEGVAGAAAGRGAGRARELRLRRIAVPRLAVGAGWAGRTGRAAAGRTARAGRRAGLRRPYGPLPGWPNCPGCCCGIAVAGRGCGGLLGIAVARLRRGRRGGGGLRGLGGVCGGVLAAGARRGPGRGGPAALRSRPAAADWAAESSALPPRSLIFSHAAPQRPAEPAGSRSGCPPRRGDTCPALRVRGAQRWFSACPTARRRALGIVLRPPFYHPDAQHTGPVPVLFPREDRPVMPLLRAFTRPSRGRCAGLARGSAGTGREAWHWELTRLGTGLGVRGRGSGAPLRPAARGAGAPAGPARGARVKPRRPVPASASPARRARRASSRSSASSFGDLREVGGVVGDLRVQRASPSSAILSSCRSILWSSFFAARASAAERSRLRAVCGAGGRGGGGGGLLHARGGAPGTRRCRAAASAGCASPSSANTRSVVRSMKNRSWQITIIEPGQPSRRSSSWVSVSMSRSLVGSSRKRTLGSSISSRSICSRRRSPPERSPTGVHCFSLVKPNCLAQLARRSSRGPCRGRRARRTCWTASSTRSVGSSSATSWER